MDDPRPDKADILYMHDSAVLGGAENSLLNLATNLAPERFQPHFLCQEDGGFAERIRDAGFTVDFCPYPSLKRPNPFRIASAARRMIRIARERGAALVHGNTPRSNFYAAIVGRRLGVPVVWHARNLLVPGMIDLDHCLSFLPSRILCNSDAIRERFKDNPKAITIINGVNFDIFDCGLSGEPVREELGIPADALVVGITSRLEPEKGHDCLLRAAAAILDRVPNAWFVIVGKAFVNVEEREAELRQLAVDMNVASRTVFTGFRRDIPQVLAAMDVCVLAAEAEPCGRVLFEAMAMGKPIVGTNTGGTPEIVVDGETGILFDPGDQEALATHVTDLCQDPQRRRAMGQAGHERAKRYFSIESHVRKTEGVYAELLGLSDGPGRDGEASAPVADAP